MDTCAESIYEVYRHSCWGINWGVGEAIGYPLVLYYPKHGPLGNFWGWIVALGAWSQVVNVPAEAQTPEQIRAWALLTFGNEVTFVTPIARRGWDAIPHRRV